MQKLYKLQSLIMSPLLVMSLIIILPMYYIYKSIDKILYNRDCIDLVFSRP